MGYILTNFMAYLPLKYKEEAISNLWQLASNNEKTALIGENGGGVALVAYNKYWEVAGFMWEYATKVDGARKKILEYNNFILLKLSAEAMQEELLRSICEYIISEDDGIKERAFSYCLKKSREASKEVSIIFDEMAGYIKSAIPLGKHEALTLNSYKDLEEDNSYSDLRNYNYPEKLDEEVMPLGNSFIVIKE